MFAIFYSSYNSYSHTMFYLMMQLYPYISYLSTMFYYFFLCFLSDPCCWVYIKFLPEKFLRNQIWKEFCQAQARLRPTAACETACSAKKVELSYKKFDIDPPAAKLPGRQRADPPALKLRAGNEQTHPRQCVRGRNLAPRTCLYNKPSGRNPAGGFVMYYMIV